MPNPKASPASIARKEWNRDRNKLRNADNVARVAEYGIPARESIHKKFIVGRDGKAIELTRTRNVRPSKLVRSYQREQDRAIKAIILGRAAGESVPE